MAYLGLGNEVLGKSLLHLVEPGLTRDEMFYNFLKKYAEKKGDYKQAFFYQEKYNQFFTQKRMSSLAKQGELLTLDRQIGEQNYKLQLLQIKNKEIKTKWLITSIIAGLLLTLLILTFQNRKNKVALQMLIKRIQEMTDKQIILIKEAEQQGTIETRKRIGISLHNNLASIIAVTAQFLRNSIDDSTNLQVKTRANEIADTLEKNYIDVRELSHNLKDSSTFKSPFWSVLHQTINVFFINTGIKVNVNVDPADINEIPMELKILILEILKEAATNIVKHSKATRIDILIYEDLKSIHIDIGNNGINAFVQRGNKKGLGINYIRKRVLSTSGKLEIIKENNNFHLKIVLPYRNNDNL